MFAKGMNKWMGAWMNHEEWPVFLTCISPLMRFRRPLSGFYVHLSVSKEA